MKALFGDLLRRRLSTEEFDLQLGQWSCWAGAFAMLILVGRKLAAMELTEAQLIFGLLLTIANALLFTIAGYVVPLAARLKRSAKQ